MLLMKYVLSLYVSDPPKMSEFYLHVWPLAPHFCVRVFVYGKTAWKWPKNDYIKKMAKNSIFGYLDHSKGAIWRILNDLTQDIWWSNWVYHSILSKYAISSQSNTSNSRKRPKTSFLAIWISQKGQFGDFWMIQLRIYDGYIERLI